MDHDTEKRIHLLDNITVRTSRRCWERWSLLVKKPWKMSLTRSVCLRVLLALVILLLIIFRGHVICLLGFVNCYVTWPFTSPSHIRLDLLSLSNGRQTTSGHETIPRRLHHILLGPLSASPPVSWLSARNSCLVLHSHFEKHHFWDDHTGRDFLALHYSWFVKTWNSYPTDIQKADALRYFVLYHYGGIFLDMDLFCRQPLNGLLTYLDRRVSTDQQIFLAVKAFPVGISNGFMIATRQHPLLHRVIDNLELYNRNFLLPHATIVISTGPMCISIQIQLNRYLWNSILVLDGKENMLGGKTDTPLFKHLGSGSWHRADETFFKNIPMNIQHQSQTFSITIILLITFLLLLFVGRKKHWIKVSPSPRLSSDQIPVIISDTFHPVDQRQVSHWSTHLFLSLSSSRLDDDPTNVLNLE